MELGLDRRREPSLFTELRSWLIQFLCLWMLIQGPPLEAAEQRLRSQLHVMEAAVEAPAEKSASFGRGFLRTLSTTLARVAAWSSFGSPEPQAVDVAASQKRDPALADLPPGQNVPPPPKPPGATFAAGKDSPTSARSGGPAGPSPKAAIPVAPAFNLLSVSWQPADPSPAAVLEPIATAVGKVYAYDACDPADTWKVYDPASPGASDLTAITPAKGFWLESSGTATVALPEAGPVPASVSIPLCVGWNLIGFPFEIDRVDGIRKIKDANDNRSR